MQDRFKFRAYYKVDKKMHNVNAIIAQENCIELFEAGEEPSPDDFKGIITARKEMCVLMQCTGLKDKNGTLIYEGDIVKDTMYKSGTVCDETYLKVVYDTCTFRFEPDMVFTDLFYHHHKVEIVGNIYENPELLKEIV